MRKALLAIALSSAFGANATVLQPFSFDGSGFGGTAVKDIGLADFSYAGDVDYLGDSFAFNGVAFLSSFRKDFQSPPISGTGLGDKYNVYFYVQGTGTRTNIVPGINKGDFNQVAVAAFVDPNRDTTIQTVTPGLLNGNETTIPSGNTGDDVFLFNADLVSGQAFQISSQSKGAWDLVVDATTVNTTLLGQGFAKAYPDIHLSGVNTFLASVDDPPSVNFDVSVLGSGNMNVVPEPGSYLMMLAGLLIAGVRWLKKGSV